MVFNLRKLLPEPPREIPPQILADYTAHYAGVMQNKFGYRRTEFNAAGFDAVARFIAHWRAAGEGRGDYPARGLFLFGSPGTGKTTAVQFISGLCEMDFVSTDELSRAFSLRSGEGFWRLADEYKKRPLVVDDLGCEETSRSFGNTLPMAEFIRDRERQWKEAGICTCFTSNARSREELSKRYGSSVCSRLLGMCDFIQIKGPDKRLER